MQNFIHCVVADQSESRIPSYAECIKHVQCTLCTASRTDHFFFCWGLFWLCLMHLITAPVNYISHTSCTYPMRLKVTTVTTWNLIGPATSLLLFPRSTSTYSLKSLLHICKPNSTRPNCSVTVKIRAYR